MDRSRLLRWIMASMVFAGLVLSTGCGDMWDTSMRQGLINSVFDTNSQSGAFAALGAFITGVFTGQITGDIGGETSNGGE